MTRRALLASLGPALAATAARLPANRNVKWALSAALWNHFRQAPLTDILDLMRDTGFIGLRVTGFPGFLERYGMTAAQVAKEVARRNVRIVTISFNGPAGDPAQHARVLGAAKAAMEFLKIFGASHLVVFSPPRVKPGADADAAFRAMCACFNRIGELAGTMGFTAGLHNHLDQMAESPEEIHRCLRMTDPMLFGFSPDTAHLHLAGASVPAMLEQYKRRLSPIFDYKDARWTTPAADFREDSGKVHPKDSRTARFLSSIYDLGDGEIDFPACHRILKSIGWKGWLCVDLDTARQGPRVSYERQAAYVVNRLEPIYA